jgi:hemolysin III
MHVIDRPSKYSKEYLKKLFQYTLAEDIANTIIHVVGAFFGIYALINLTWIAARYGSAIDSFAFIFYGLSILFMFLMSSLYHSMINHTARSVFKKLDHIAIYILILGTYTPYIFSLVKNQRGYIIYAILVLMTILGAIFKSFYAGRFKLISTFVYIVMGWAVVGMARDIFVGISYNALLFLILGGLSYTVGALLYAFGKFKFSHAIWHVFVLLGVIFHYISVTFFILQYR